MNIYAKENLSTKQPSPCKETRLQSENGDQERTCRFETPQSQRTQEINGSTLLDFSLPKQNRLRKPGEFRRVYSQGKQLKGRFMTVFFMPSGTAFQRLGITASKKAIGNAVARNRAKRLLREAFRLNRAELEHLETKYDWVLNARRSLLQTKLDEPLAELRHLIGKVKSIETKIIEGEKNVAS